MLDDNELFQWLENQWSLIVTTLSISSLLSPPGLILQIISLLLLTQVNENWTLWQAKITGPSRQASGPPDTGASIHPIFEIIFKRFAISFVEATIVVISKNQLVNFLNLYFYYMSNA